MPLATLNTIKNWFRTTFKPTQAQYWDTWDSFWHKEESIPTAAVTGLDAQLAKIPVTVIKNVSGADTYLLNADTKLESIYLKTTDSENVKVGLTVGGGEYFDDTVEPGSPVNFDMGLIHDSNITIHLTGNFTAKIFTR